VSIDIGKRRKQNCWEKIEIEKDLRRVEKEGLLNIQPLVVRSPPHSSFSKCVEG
jgi:hypothetical protein